MNTRQFTAYATSADRMLLDNLLKPNIAPADYRQVMTKLGRALGNLPKAKTNDKVLIVSTAEDADFLTSGCVESLERQNIANVLAVFWNHHHSLPNGSSVAPILNSYIQEGIEDCTRVFLVKSIVSGSCVIRTNLLALLDKLNLAHISEISIIAPVMHKDGEAKLNNEFPEHIRNKFAFYTFAIDSEKDPKTGIVHQGIGGEIYRLLGLSGQPAVIGGYMPRIVENRLFG